MIPYSIMNGAGNRFVILDARASSMVMNATTAKNIANPTSGIGCDQLIVMEPSARADVFMRIYNSDGSEVGACGNATRCVGWLMMEEAKTDRVVVETTAGLLPCRREDAHVVAVDMGEPRLTPKDIPLAENIDPKALPISQGVFKDGIAIGMGNPHAVFFVDDVGAADLVTYGPRIEKMTEIFPERVNVSAAKIMDHAHMILRVWERGAGMTLACGTAACAAVVAAAQQGLTSRNVEVTMPGGVLTIKWDVHDHVWLIGPIEFEKSSEISL